MSVAMTTRTLMAVVMTT